MHPSPHAYSALALEAIPLAAFLLAFPAAYVFNRTNESGDLIFVGPFLVAAILCLLCIAAFAVSGLGWLRLGHYNIGGAVMAARGTFTLFAYLSVPWYGRGSDVAFWSLVALSAAGAIASLISLALYDRAGAARDSRAA